MRTTLTLTCPACDSPLKAISEDGTNLVWCSVGRCPSLIANDGLKGGQPVDELARKLIGIIEQDETW